MAGKRKDSQLYGIIALVAIVVFGVWAMVKLLNQNKVTTQSEATVRYGNQPQQRKKLPWIPTTCNSRCNPASDSCNEGLTCINVNSRMKNFPPDYRCRSEKSPESPDCCGSDIYNPCPPTLRPWR